MRFGPFEAMDIDGIEKILKKNGVRYRFESDSEELKKQETEYHHNAQNATIFGFSWGFKYHIRNIYVEIDDGDLEKLGSKLENYGIISSHKKYIVPEPHNNSRVQPETDRGGLVKALNIIGVLAVWVPITIATILIVYLLFLSITR